jgi:hypothetical protein
MSVCETAVKRTLKRLTKSPFDEEFISEFLIPEIGHRHSIRKFITPTSIHPKTISRVLKQSSDLHHLIQRRSKILVDPYINRWLDVIPVLLIPSRAFVAEAVLDKKNGPTPFVVFSEGFLSFIRFMGEYSILVKVYQRHNEILKLPLEEQQVRYLDLEQIFMKILIFQLQPNRATPLPTLEAEIPMGFDMASETLANLALIFAFLHEVGHCELGHLQQSRYLEASQIIRNEISQIKDDVKNRMETDLQRCIKLEEHEADLFAIQSVEGESREILIGGAKYFFLLLSAVQNIIGCQSKTHPSAAARVNFLNLKLGCKGEFDEYEDNFFERIESASSMGVTSIELREEGFFGRIFRENKSKCISEELLTIAIYNIFSNLIFDKVKENPGKYKGIIPKVDSYL